MMMLKDKQTRDMYCKQALISSFFSEANFPKNADLIFFIFKSAFALRGERRERE